MLSLFLFSCGQTKTNNQTQTLEAVPEIDTSTFAILKFDTTDTWLFKNVKPTSLTKNEIKETEKLLKQCIDQYNPGQQLQFDTISKAHPEYNLQLDDFLINLSRYKRQYVPVVNSAGQKEVWVNCFCDHFNFDWRNQIVKVNDGGNCYFHLRINLMTKSFYRFSVNGEA